MARLRTRNLPDEVHRALRVRAAQHGRSTEAEVRDILEQAAKPEGRLKLGSMLASIAREAGARASADGKVIGKADAYIAATAAARALKVATQDVSAFQAAGLTVIDPWEESARRMTTVRP